MFGYLRISVRVWILSVRVQILPVWVRISNLPELNNCTDILLLRFRFSDRIQIHVRIKYPVLINRMNKVSLIDIHIIYIYLSFEINYILYKIYKYVNFKTSKFAVKNHLDLNILILKYALKILILKVFVINGLIFCYNKYTNVKKSYE